jgi:gamma-glutamyl-gamma-aminobutyrate hydrolase PuuD
MAEGLAAGAGGAVGHDRRPRRPVIGVSTGSTLVPIVEGQLDSHYAGRAYTAAVVAAGGLPVLLPAVAGAGADDVDDFLDLVDGIVLVGGTDIEPTLYGGDWPPVQTPDPDRDVLERALVLGAQARGVPLLGVCRGMQMINVALGGTLHEHIEHEQVEAQRSGTFADVRLHTLPLDAESLAQRVLGRDEIEVLCMHHQAPDRIGEGLRVTARAEDGIVEAIELGGDSFMLGVLWHPEQMLDRGPLQARLYESLVDAAHARVDA